MEVGRGVAVSGIGEAVGAVVRVGVGAKDVGVRVGAGAVHVGAMAEPHAAINKPATLIPISQER